MGSISMIKMMEVNVNVFVLEVPENQKLQSLVLVSCVARFFLLRRNRPTVVALLPSLRSPSCFRRCSSFFSPAPSLLLRLLHCVAVPLDLYCHVSQFALKEIHKQYKVAKDGIVFPCTGQYMATMGLPCAHQIKLWQGSTYSLDCIHPQWRIDTLLLNSTNDLHDEGTYRFDDLLNELRLKYQMWPLNKKEDAFSLITKLVNQYDTVFEPVIQRPKGRPPKSKKKRGVTSTTRFPSRFELVESSQRRTFIDLNAYPFDTCDLDGPF
ncbi:hypothetical protein LXL04_032554 [Taraxacum kok-saghyz]